MSPNASPMVTQSRLTAITKNRRSMRLLRFHQGTCWISMSMARSGEEELDELEEDEEELELPPRASGFLAVAAPLKLLTPSPRWSLLLPAAIGVNCCGLMREESDLR